MEIKFTKMHGLGNDFMVIDAVNQHIRITQKHIRQWAHRHRGIGFDQCLIVEPATANDVDFNYRIFNADGREVAQCGNGARCLARFIQDKGLSRKKHLKVQTLNRILELAINPSGTITAELGIPNFTPAEIPLSHFAEQELYNLLVDQHRISFHALSVGNPHAVIMVENIHNAPVETVGRALSTHPCFPEGVNVSFMQLLDQHNIKLRVFERGVGETQACGSGACAAMICAKRFHDLADNITVELPGGFLQVSWQGDGYPVLLTGGASKVFDGSIWV